MAAARFGKKGAAVPFSDTEGLVEHAGDGGALEEEDGFIE
jgi:hypothetical protein